MTARDLFAELEAATPTVWEAAYLEATDALRSAFPAGWAPECAGQLAWDMVPESLRETVLDELFYTYAEALDLDAATKARLHRELVAEAELGTLLDRYRQASGWRGRRVRARLAHQIAAVSASLIGGASS